MTQMIITVAASLVFGGMFADNGPGDNQHAPAFSAFPQELRSIATRLSCDPTYDHYKNAVISAPPYMYGVLPDEGESSAVFWCRQISEQSASMWLVLVRFDKYTDYEDEQFIPRDGKVLNKLNWSEVETNPDWTCGLEPWGQSQVPLNLFMTWGANQRVTLPGNTSVPPISGAMRDGFPCPVFYYHKGEWLWFMQD